MIKESILLIIELIKQNEINKANEAMNKALFEQSKVSWEGRFQQVHEVNKAIQKIKLSHRWYKTQFELIPLQKRLLVELKMLEIEQEFYLKPLALLIHKKKKISRNR